MDERANGLRGGLQLNASDLPMLVGTDPAASASRVRYNSRRASLSRLNGDVFARLDKIATPSKVLSQLAWRAASSPGGACPHGANGRLAPSAQDKSLRTLARFAGVCPHRFVGGLSPRSMDDLSCDLATQYQ